MSSDGHIGKRGSLVLNLAGKPAIVRLHRGILNAGVDHGCGQIFMSKQFLDLDNVHACIE